MCEATGPRNSRSGTGSSAMVTKITPATMSMATGTRSGAQASTSGLKDSASVTWASRPSMSHCQEWKLQVKRPVTWPKSAWTSLLPRWPQTLYQALMSSGPAPVRTITKDSCSRS